MGNTTYFILFVEQFLDSWTHVAEIIWTGTTVVVILPYLTDLDIRVQCVVLYCNRNGAEVYLNFVI